MEYTIYVVQHWIDRYKYWSDGMERTEGLFDFPRIGYELESDARAKLAALRESWPSGKYRLIRRTTTETEI